MAIRLQPLDIDIPADDPFKNDLLSRKDSAEVLTHIVGSIEGPCRTFETTIITGFIEQQTGGDFYRSFHSPLLEKYKKVVERNEQDHGQNGVEKSGDQPRDLEYEHARDIVLAVENMRQKQIMGLRPVEFSYSVQRLELISSELMGGAPGTPSHDE